jgi:hypothetical protein
MEFPRFMMATKAIHPARGYIFRDGPIICRVTGEDVALNCYIGAWVESGELMEVKFPAETTRDLTPEELKCYVQVGGEKCACCGANNGSLHSTACRERREEMGATGDMKVNMPEIHALEIAGLNPEALFANGFEKALVGYVEQAGRVLAAYDRRACVNILVARGDMDCEEAEEFFVRNVLGAYVGENTPVFLTIF